MCGLGSVFDAGDPGLCHVSCPGHWSQSAGENKVAIFSLQKVCCLILQLSQWATDAFFKYGGEPKMTIPPPPYPPMGGVSPMQTTPPGSMGIHGQFHATPQQASTPQYGTQTPAQYGTQTPAQYGTQAPVQYGMRTPNFGMTLGRAVVGPEVELSPKHNGLCRYLSRLLRPLWNERVIHSHLPTRTEPEEVVSCV